MWWSRKETERMFAADWSADFIRSCSFLFSVFRSLLCVWAAMYRRRAGVPDGSRRLRSRPFEDLLTPCWCRLISVDINRDWDGRVHLWLWFEVYDNSVLGELNAGERLLFCADLHHCWAVPVDAPRYWWY